MQKRMFKAFTLLELIVVVIVLGILALVAVPAFTGVINNSTGSVAENTAKAIARDANALAAFNAGANANLTNAADIEEALCETTLADGGWGTSFSAGVATVSLNKNNETASYTISVASDRAVVATSGTDVAAGTLHAC
jgi:prepilin-type N-terminal cleavage/methylation domain-containing protein